MELTKVTTSLAFKGHGYFSFFPTLQKTGRIYVPDLQKITEFSKITPYYMT